METKKRKKENLKRPRDLRIRASDEEFRTIDERAKASGMSRNEFAMRCLTGKSVVVISGVDTLLIELKRQGNNFNQALHNVYLNSAGEDDLIEAERECRKIYELIKKLLRGDAGNADIQS